MNLHQIASGAIGVVNPFVPVQVYAGKSYVTEEDGTRTPTYENPVTVMAQLQDLTHDDLQQMENLNIQGVRRAIYMNGNWTSIIRVSGDPGDKVVINGQTWLIVQVPEGWPDWTKVLVCLQNDERSR